MQDLLDTAAAWIRDADSILAITGAGLSADSGLPTYRGVGGLYDDQDTEDGVPIEVALSGQMFQARPEITWRYIRGIEEACRGRAPNAGHEVLAWLEARKERVWVLTQNVDGFHRRAGSDKVIAIHGDLHHLHCTACRWSDTVDDYAHLDPLPRCPDCDAVVRPDVVLFGEMLPTRELATFQRELSRGFDLVLSIGTTSVFPYIAQPVRHVRLMGGKSIEVNPGVTEVSHAVDLKLPLGAAQTLTSLRERLER